MDKIKYNGDTLTKRSDSLQVEAYKPSEGLIAAVNLALLLEQPLLLMGEPGCGKTRLAEAVAAELHKEKWKDHYFRWDIKSTSKAREGIYQYDALRRMYDAGSSDAAAKDVNNYITNGKFADALTKPQNGNIPNILLIDEIDKADMDFPNDLLLEIEREFSIPELGNKTITAKSKVLIFITSNRERQLPAAFLRRCLYYYIPFPSQEHLTDIVNAKFSKEQDDALVKKAVELFLDIRTTIDNRFAENEKKPSTSELLEWFRAIDNSRSNGQSNAQIENAIMEYKKGNIEGFRIPFPQALLKTLESTQLFELG